MVAQVASWLRKETPQPRSIPVAVAELGPWEILPTHPLKGKLLLVTGFSYPLPGTGETSQGWLRVGLVRTGVAGCLPGCHFTDKKCVTRGTHRHLNADLHRETEAHWDGGSQSFPKSYPSDGGCRRDIQGGEAVFCRLPCNGDPATRLVLGTLF